MTEKCVSIYMYLGTCRIEIYYRYNISMFKELLGSTPKKLISFLSSCHYGNRFNKVCTVDFLLNERIFRVA